MLYAFNTRFFLWILQNFLEHLFWKTAASEGSECTIHIETNQLVWNLNQLTGFYWGGTLVKKNFYLSNNFFETPICSVTIIRYSCCRKNLVSFHTLLLRKKCLYSEFLWAVFSPFGLNTEVYVVTSSYPVQMLENTDEENSEFWKLLTQCSVMPKEFHGDHPKMNTPW